MLDEVPSRRSSRNAFRLSNVPLDDDFMSELQLDPRGGEELHELLADSGHSVDIDELVDAPFRPKRRLRNRTRFSDGSFPVFYASLDAETAEAEIRHWLPRFIGRPRNPRTAFYQRFSCKFHGVEKDLRPKIDDWPDLVHDSDYSFCNQLGAEARSLQIDGLVTWSARHEGANLPVFRRRAVSSPKLEDVVSMTYHPDTGDVSVIGPSETRDSGPRSAG